MDLSKLLSFTKEFEKSAKSPKMWSKKPHGWKEKSVKQYSKTMTKGEEHPFTECVEKMEDKVDNPEAFCASVKDISKGTTGWRKGKGKKKASNSQGLEKRAQESVLSFAEALEQDIMEFLNLFPNNREETFRAMGLKDPSRASELAATMPTAAQMITRRIESSEIADLPIVAPEVEAEGEEVIKAPERLLE